MSATIVEDCLIKPDVAALKDLGLTESSEYLLSGFDYAYARMRPPYYVFRFDEILNIDELKIGLQAVVNECPILGSKLNCDKMPFRFSQLTHGVPMIVKSVDTDFDDLPFSGSKMEEWERTGIYELLAPEKEVKFTEVPMMGVAIVLYPKQNVSFLGIMRQHMVGDGNACCLIFHRWSYLTAILAGKERFLNEKNIILGSEPLRHSRAVYFNGMEKHLPSLKVDLKLIDTPKLNKYYGENNTIHELKKELESMTYGGTSETKNKQLTWLECRIDMSRMNLFKDSLVESLKFMDSTNLWNNEVKWLSSFETMAGIMLASKIKAVHASELLDDKNNLLILPPRCSFTFNTRKKYKNKTEVAHTIIGTAAYKLIGDYFSNEFLSLAKSTKLSSTELIALCSHYFHNTLRAEFSKEDEMVDEIDLVDNLPNYSSMIYDGDLTKSKFVNIPNLTSFSKKNEVVSLNSWAAFDWLDLNFGSENKQRFSAMTRKRPGFSNFWFQFKASNEHYGGIMSFSSENERDLVKREMSKLVCLNNIVSLL